MAKKRIHEIAKEKNWPAKAIIAIAKEAGLDVKNAMSAIDDSDVKKLEGLEPKIKAYKGSEKEDSKPQPTPQAPRQENRTQTNTNYNKPRQPQQRQNEPRMTTATQPVRTQPVSSTPIEKSTDFKERLKQNSNRPVRRNDDRGPARQQPAGQRPATQQPTTSTYRDNRNGTKPTTSTYRDNRNAGGQSQGTATYRDNRPAQGGTSTYRDNRQGQSQGTSTYRDNRNNAGGQRQGQGGYQNRNQGQQRPNTQNRNQQAGGIERKITNFNKDAVVAPPVQQDTRRQSAKRKDYREVSKEKALSHKKRKEEQRREMEAQRAIARKVEEERLEALKREERTVHYKDSLTVGELSQLLGVGVAEIIKYLFNLGMMATMNHTLDPDVIELVASEYNATVVREVSVDEADLDSFFAQDFEGHESVTRPPVVTIMGHVDHGKTTLLDTIRKTKVTAGEAGGITQHIGAYQVDVNGKPITFLDTPGHEAFTMMRARGAQITDIAVIVVAADDGVMPQTREAVEHAKAAGVPIVVAVNKMDKPGANPDRVMTELMELHLVPEAWGGDTIYANISALTGLGIEEFLETLTLVAEVQELKAVADTAAIGTIVEARLDKGKGPVATLLVQTGTLNRGDAIVAGSSYGRVRTMETEFGENLKVAGPATPVEITGLNSVPSAGDRFVVFEDDKKARQIGEERAQRQQMEQRRQTSAMTLEDLNTQMKQGNMKEINVVIKADVQGSAEAVAQSFRKIEVEGARVKIVRSAVGAISESDVMLALASNAIIYGFNVRPDASARQTAEKEGVEIRQHSIIYRAIEELEAAMIGMLDPEYEEKFLGNAEIRETFKVSKVGTIAGAYVTEGKLERDAGIRVIRDGIVIFDGKLATLKRFKDDAKEVKAGFECGFTVANYNEIQVGDVVEAYTMQEIKRK